MVAPSLRILILESDAQRAVRFAELLANDESEQSSIEFEIANTLAEGRRKLEAVSWNAVMTRLSLPDAKGLEALVEFHVSSAETPVIVILGDEEPQVVLDAAQSLADDCLFWNDMDRVSVRQAIHYAIERKEMLSDLKERQSRANEDAVRTPFRALLDQIDEAVFLIARDNRQLLYANEVARAWFSDSLEEIKATLEGYRILEDESLEVEISTTNPAVPVAELRSTWLDWKGIPACMATLRNDSKRRRTEEAFLASQRRLSLALKASNIGLWSWDMQSRNPIFSERWKKQLGYSNHSFPDTIVAFKNHLHPEDRERAFSLFRRFIRDPWNEFECEYRMRSQSGEYRNILCRAEMVRDRNGHASRLIGSHIDITERKQQEEAKALIDERLELSRRDEQFNSVVEEWSHSVANSIQAFRSTLEAVQRSLASDNGDKTIVREDLDKAASELATLESKLPKIRRESPDERSSVDLGDLALKVARDREMKLPQNCSFEIELGRQVPVVSVNERIVSRLLTELLACSCEVLNERQDARLTVRTGFREVNHSDLSLMANGEGRLAGKYSYLEIEDNGTRFSLRAFKEALSCDEETSLSRALRFGFKSGAAIDLARRAGDRTSLRIYFPATPDGAVLETLKPNGSDKVLVAEDETALHPMIEAVVRSIGLEAVLEVDGCAAWEKYKQEPNAFRMAILDVNLPGCDGNRLYDMLAEDRDVPLPTLFVSGDTEDAEMAGSNCHGPIRKLPKPYRMAELKALVSELASPHEMAGV